VKHCRGIEPNASTAGVQARSAIRSARPDQIYGAGPALQDCLRGAEIFRAI